MKKIVSIIIILIIISSCVKVEDKNETIVSNDSPINFDIKDSNTSDF